MSRRLPVTPAPAPLEADSQHCDPRFAKRHQRDVLRRYLAGLRLPTERNTTRTARANTDPVRGAQHPRAQARQWFLAESPWSPERGTTQRRPLLRAAPLTAPDAHGVLVIDASGDRKAGTKPAHVGRQYSANLGNTDNGVVALSTRWADEQVDDPLEVAP